MADGSVLVVEIARGALTRVRPDGALEVVADCGGGPNGAAVGPDGAVYVCNNGGCFDWQELLGLTFPGSPPPAAWPGHGSLQRVDLATGEVTTVLTECGGVSRAGAQRPGVRRRRRHLVHRSRGPEERTSDRTGIHYSRPDGSEACVAVFPLDAPNGIGLSPAGDRLYVAETHTGRLWGVGRHRPRRGDRLRPRGPGAPNCSPTPAVAPSSTRWPSTATAGSASPPWGAARGSRPSHPTARKRSTRPFPTRSPRTSASPPRAPPSPRSRAPASSSPSTGPAGGRLPFAA